jgi:sigma-B regulation protein RsbU (phosphoserine phosphatase)
LEDQVLAALRGQLADIILGAGFLFIASQMWGACSIAAIRRQGGVRLFIWLGVWSAMYGIGLLTRSSAVVAALPASIQIAVPYVNTAIAYLTVVVGLSAFFELSRGFLRLLIKVLIVAGVGVALAGIGWFVSSGSDDKFFPYNTLVAVSGLLVLVPVVAVKKLSDKFLVLLDRRVLAVGTLVFAVEALWVNLSRPLHYPTPRLLDHIAFAVFLLSFGYVAMQIIVANERRLRSIENELAVARRLQFSILPESIPEVPNVRIAVTYEPMTSVAGDFYEFIPIDRQRVGFLVADVTGHGVPAALIASMIKVAMQSVVSCAHDPGEVLRGLNRILFRQLHDQLVSAAYLWLDIESYQAAYSAAGHPPLLRSRDGKIERIESNGLLFGVMADPDYPVCNLPIRSGDRFLLYTDGVIEPENVRGDSFGHSKLAEVVRNHQARPPGELVDQLLSEIRQWQPASVTQQDDITLIVIDVV